MTTDPDAPDLNDFTPWREAFCNGCGRVTLVTGPRTGPARCRLCWAGGPHPRRAPGGQGGALTGRRPPGRSAPAQLEDEDEDEDQGELFDTAPFHPRKGGA